MKRSLFLLPTTMLLWGCASKIIVEQPADAHSVAPPTTAPAAPVTKNLDTSKIKNMADVRMLFDAFDIKMVVPQPEDKAGMARYDKVKKLLK